MLLGAAYDQGGQPRGFQDADWSTTGKASPKRLVNTIENISWQKFDLNDDSVAVVIGQQEEELIQ